jgi:ATP-dependent RNA circularization protein (DNA/RNA ligase family)
MAVKYDIENWLSRHCKSAGQNLAVQGEICGPGIQSNREKLNEVQFFVFDIWDIDRQAYLGSNERAYITSYLALPHVPVLPCVSVSSVDGLLEGAKGHGLNNECREGIVVKLIDYPDRSFKVINNDYLEKHGL